MWMTHCWRCFEEATNLVPILKHLNCMVELHQYKSMASGIDHKHQKSQNWEVKLLSSSWTGCTYIKSPPESEARGYGQHAVPWLGQMRHLCFSRKSAPPLLPVLLWQISCPQAEHWSLLSLLLNLLFFSVEASLSTTAFAERNKKN